jgi:hypothetical protein
VGSGFHCLRSFSFKSLCIRVLSPVLALDKAPPEIEKEKQQRLMKIRQVVSHAIRPAPSPLEASRSKSKLAHQIP